MPVNAESISKFSDLQPQIWQTVSTVLSETVGQAIAFSDPLTTGARPSDLLSEFNQPMMVIQFAFAGLPENPQVVLFPQETVLELVSLVRNEEVTEVDENTVTELRPALEAVVQGLCLAVGTVKNETIVASGLTIRFQVFSFPPNLQRGDEIVRSQIALLNDAISGTVLWMLDLDTVHAVIGAPEIEAEDHGVPFPTATSVEFPSPSARGAAPVHEDPQGLDLLMDIPLEISVELGRVRMLVREVVELGAGSIVEIEKAAGEPVDVMVNGRLVARGEVVVIEDNFGVRITEILNPHERLNKLGDAA